MTSLFAAVQNAKQMLIFLQTQRDLDGFSAIDCCDVFTQPCNSRLESHQHVLLDVRAIAGQVHKDLHANSSGSLVLFSWLRFQDWDEIIERHRKIGLRHPHTIAFPGPKNPLTLSKTLLNWDHVPSCWDGNFSHRTSILQGGKAHSLLSSNKS